MNRTPFDENMKDVEYRRLFNQEALILEVTEAICGYMEEHEITRVELAKRLGKTKGFVSQLLNGDRNLTLRTLADIVDALGCSLNVDLVQKGGEAVDRCGRGPAESSWLDAGNPAAPFGVISIVNKHHMMFDSMLVHADAWNIKSTAGLDIAAVA